MKPGRRLDQAARRDNADPNRLALLDGLTRNQLIETYATLRELLSLKAG
ncbi:hypothetical protein [Streptomyces sp. NBC_00306]|nr:hypothetical protein [Streptomyces sp. NBC_00306]